VSTFPWTLTYGHSSGWKISGARDVAPWALIRSGETKASTQTEFAVGPQGLG